MISCFRQAGSAVASSKLCKLIGLTVVLSCWPVEVWANQDREDFPGQRRGAGTHMQLSAVRPLVMGWRGDRI